MWDDMVAVAFFLAACPFIVIGPLIVFLAIINWRPISPSARLATAIAILTMATLSLIALRHFSGFWTVRFYLVSVFWLLNVPLIGLIWLCRRSDRRVEAEAHKHDVRGE